MLNIVPTKLTVDYCVLVRECLQRDCKAADYWVEWLVSKQDEDRAVIGLLAEVSANQGYSLVPSISNIAQRLQKALQEKDEYGLAVAHIFVTQLAGLLDPYLENILSLVLASPSEHVKKFLSNFVGVI